MDALEAIECRKSVRSYEDTPVEDEKIQAVVRAGYEAAGTPMSGKTYLSVVTNKDVLAQLAAATKQAMAHLGVPQFEKMAASVAYNPIYGAPVAVIVSTDAASDPATSGMLTANAACAGQNMLVAATALGLGSCYTASPTLGLQDPAVRAATKVPEGATPQAVIVFGYTADTTPHAKRPDEPDTITYVG